MTLQIEVTQQQYEAVAIVLKAMNIPIIDTDAEQAYEQKVEDNLLKIMLDYEKEGVEVLSEEETMDWLSAERQKFGI